MEQRLEENNVKNENNRKKEYLRGYRSSRRRINRIDDEIIELKELAVSVKAIDYSGMPHGNGNQKDLSDELARIDSLVEKLGAEKESCVESYVSIEKQIKEIKNEDENDVLFYRYVKGLRFWEIAEKMDYSEQWVHKLHGRALAFIFICVSLLKFSMQVCYPYTGIDEQILNHSISSPQPNKTERGHLVMPGVFFVA